jgi:hypothetical protein
MQRIFKSSEGAQSNENLPPNRLGLKRMKPMEDRGFLLRFLFVA